MSSSFCFAFQCILQYELWAVQAILTNIQEQKHIQYNTGYNHGWGVTVRHSNTLSYSIITTESLFPGLELQLNSP